MRSSPDAGQRPTIFIRDRQIRGARDLRLALKPEALEDAGREPLAAAPGKRERVHQDRADLFVELVADELPRAVQPGLHRFRLDAEKVRGVLDAHALDDA